MSPALFTLSSFLYEPVESSAAAVPAWQKLSCFVSAEYLAVLRELAKSLRSGRRAPSQEDRAVTLVEHVEETSHDFVESALLTARQWRTYWAFQAFRPISNLLLFLYMLIALLEEPKWCHAHGCGDPSLILRSPLNSQMSIRTAHALDAWKPWSRTSVAFCLAAFVDNFLSIFNWVFLNIKKMQKSYSICCFCLKKCLFIFDVAPPTGFPPESINWGPLLRPFVFTCMSSFTQEFLRDALPAFFSRRVLELILMQITFTLIWAWWGLLLFADEDPRFGSWEAAWLSVHTFFTTANHPDVMMIVYTNDRFSVIYFASYLILVVYMTFNVLLAAMFSGYRAQVKLRVEQERTVHERTLQRIFSILADIGPPEHRRISRNAWGKFWSQYCRHAPTEGNIRQGEEIFGLLDKFAEDPYFGISQAAFQLIGFLLVNPEVQVQPKYHTISRLSLRGLIIMRRIVDVACLVSVAISIWQTFTLTGTVAVDRMDSGAERIVYLCIFALQLAELALKGWAYGRHWRNAADLTVALPLAFLEIHAVMASFHPLFYQSERHLRWLTLIRAARIERVVYAIAPLRRAMKSIAALLTTFRKIASGLVLILFFFSALGVQLFGGLIRTDSAALRASDFGQTTSVGYFANNFNDFSSGLVVLFELMVVNNWYVIAEGLAIVSPLASEVGNVFCITFYALNHILLVNVLIASVVECFDRAVGGDTDEDEVWNLTLIFCRRGKPKDDSDEPTRLHSDRAPVRDEDGLLLGDVQTIDFAKRMSDIFLELEACHIEVPATKALLIRTISRQTSPDQVETIDQPMVLFRMLSRTQIKWLGPRIII